MKLIIDIPDDYVEDFKIEQKFLDNELTDNVNRYDMARYAIANGIPLEEELKKIKAEIIEYRDNEANDIDFEIGAINAIIAIVKKHISRTER